MKPHSFSFTIYFQNITQFAEFLLLTIDSILLKKIMHMMLSTKIIFKT